MYVGQLNITLTPSGISVIEYGDTINISCASNSNIEVDEVIYSWTFNENVTNINSSVLTIEYNSAESVTQGGLYQCFTHALGMILTATSNRILIAFAPAIISSPEFSFSDHNDSVTLNCTAVGHPLPTVEWYRLESNITIEDFDSLYNYTIELPKSSFITNFTDSFEITSSLNIDPVNYNDYGYYVCVARVDNESLVLVQDCCSNEQSISTDIGKYYEISDTSILTGNF